MFRIQFTNPYLGEKLFKKTVSKENIPPLTFALPTSEQTLLAFMESHDGLNFTHHAAQIIDKLISWSLQNDIFRMDVERILNNIKDRFTYKSVATLSNLSERFILCTNGLDNFHAINILLTHDYHSIKYKINQIKILIRNLSGACDDGVITYTNNTRTLLSTNPTAFLTAVKRFLAENAATDALGKYEFAAGINDYVYIEEDGDFVIQGNHVHYVNAIVNFYNEQLAIEQIADDRANIRIEKIERKLKRFMNHVNDHFVGHRFVHELAKQFDLSDIERKLSIDYQEAQRQLTQRLDALGNDELFNLALMLDQDALADDRFVFLPNALKMLKITLIERLMNNDYFRRVMLESCV